jgi:type II secretory pathway pseudopilin PulG
MAKMKHLKINKNKIMHENASQELACFGRKISSKGGFSIVEMLVVITIIIAMTVLMFVSYNGNKNKTEVEAAARMVAAQVRGLQNEALNGKQIEDGSGNMVLVCDYVFNIDASSDSSVYQIRYKDCTPGAHQFISGPGATRTIHFSNKDSIVSSSSVGFYFTSPLGQLDATSRIVLQSKSDSTKQASICVCNSGNIYDQKGTGACGC